ncbi:hypothetical protein [Paraflavitalea speifideaquila]|uniref:hypothetical protein n=1 Tax=Paraflavitalea speifideaquila TaxID=3076558 RepID=UPI0028E90C3A|nr:hypothetical protein [Paraflavitalea speifideiaquila]
MKKLLISAIAFGTLITIISCEKERIITYDGPDAIEFYPVARTVYTPTFVYPDSAKIQFVAPQRVNDAKVTYGIDATNSTAVAATDYQITGTTGETAVPANTSFAFIKYNLSPATASKKLIFTLSGGDNVKVSENYKTHTLTIAPTPVIFTPNTKAITFAGSTATIRDTVRVRLNATAARFSQPMTLNYTVRAASTAVEGTDYAFVSVKGVATVPARSADALVILDINPVAAQKTLVLDVTAVTGISLTTSTRIVTYTIKP